MGTNDFKVLLGQTLKSGRSKRAQSAMEYLMTYGWAILIIAIVIGAMFSIGLFNSGTVIGTSCIGNPGFYCAFIMLGTDGNLSFIFGQNTGSPIYNMGMACSAVVSANGGGPNGGTIVYLSLAGSATNVPANAPANGVLSIASSSQFHVGGVKCFGLNGGALTNQQIGTAFTGSLWINYTLQPGNPTNIFGNNPMYSQQFARVSAKVS